MATKSKNSKAVSNLDVVNVSLKSVFESVVNLDAEMTAYEQAVRMLKAGEISVRGLTLTIEAANERGALPTIKPSTAQDFLRSSAVRSLAGGKDKTLKDVLNATIQARKAFGSKELDSMLESGEFASFADLVKKTPTQGERKNAKSAPKSMNDFVDAFLKAKELDSLYADTSREEWQEFCRFVAKVIETNVKSKNHPVRKSA